jgi:hypothetical protein
MKIINNNFKKICKIECNCCDESHSLLLTKNKKDRSIYFEMRDIGISLRTKLKFFIKMLFNWESFTFGYDKDFFQLIMTRKMAKKLISILEKEEYQTALNSLFQLSVGKDSLIIYDCNGILLSIPNYDRDILLFSIYPYKEDINKWKFASGFSESDLNETQISELMFVINKYFLGDKNGHNSVN